MSTQNHDDVFLQPLSLNDARIVFGWRNDPTIIRLSSSQKNVLWEEHEDWIKNSVDNPDRQVYIIYYGKQAIGQVRFERMQETNNAVISVYLLNEFTGMGLGVLAIKSGIKAIFLLWNNLVQIYAYVRKDNIPSQKAFAKSGFKITPGKEYDIQDHITYSLNNYAG